MQENFRTPKVHPSTGHRVLPYDSDELMQLVIQLNNAVESQHGVTVRHNNYAHDDIDVMHLDSFSHVEFV